MGYVTQVLKYETILKAQIFLRIFEVASLVSKYKGNGHIHPSRMVVVAKKQLRDRSRDFQKFKSAADLLTYDGHK